MTHSAFLSRFEACSNLACKELTNLFHQAYYFRKKIQKVFFCVATLQALTSPFLLFHNKVTFHKTSHILLMKIMELRMQTRQSKFLERIGLPAMPLHSPW